MSLFFGSNMLSRPERNKKEDDDNEGGDELDNRSSSSKRRPLKYSLYASGKGNGGGGTSTKAILPTIQHREKVSCSGEVKVVSCLLLKCHLSIQKNNGTCYCSNSKFLNLFK